MISEESTLSEDEFNDINSDINPDSTFGLISIYHDEQFEDENSYVDKEVYLDDVEGY